MMEKFFFLEEELVTSSPYLVAWMLEHFSCAFFDSNILIKYSCAVCNW